MNERKQQTYLVRAGAVSFNLDDVFIYLTLCPNHFPRVKKCRTHFKTINVKLANKADQLSVHIRVQIASKAQKIHNRVGVSLHA